MTAQELDARGLALAVEAARPHLEIDGDNEGPFIRFDSVDAAVEAAIRAYLASQRAQPPVAVKGLGWQPPTPGSCASCNGSGDIGGIPSYGMCPDCDGTGIFPADPPIHHDELAVDRFAIAMKSKLARKRAEGRGGWDNKDECSNEFLSILLREHIDKGDPIDVANLAMMLHQRGERIVLAAAEAKLAAPPSEGMVDVLKVVEELKFALFSSDMTIKDRADQSARLFIAALSRQGEAKP